MMETIKKNNIENMIYEVRGKQVMLDSDLANLFGYETKNLNRTVKNNINRFPQDYCFQLNEEEYRFLRCNFFTIKNGRGKHSKYLPYAFTEYGITMLAGILKSDVAVAMSIHIVNTFISMRKYISADLMEQKYINNLVLKNAEDIKLLKETFSEFKENSNEIFYDGQIYDAYSKIVDIMNKAKNELIIIDRYADKSVLDMISNIGVNVILICKNNSLLKKIDIDKYNKQYSNLKVIRNNSFHDRYFVLDRKIIYHCGTSLNHAGSRTFSINKLEDSVVIGSLLNNLSGIV